MSENNQLKRELGQRHIALMALGSAIGVGLFLGSGSTIQTAGPGILIAYIIGGLIIFLIMRALGEMAIENPVSGSFSQYARDYLGNLAGFVTGWNYWLLWSITCIAELTAVGIFMGFWYPEVPQWIWALAALVIMMAVNFLSVKVFGELEFWFALIKIVAIIFMIATGLAMIIFGFGNGGIPTGISNLWKHGGFLPNGVTGILMSLQMVMFAFLGTEMIGVTAGEAKNPEKTLAKAINTVFLRILIFYIGALFVIMSIYPWSDIGQSGSPFVLTFDKIGIPAAAGIINFVVVTAALSSCNAGIFSTGRMLNNLAENGEAPRIFAKISKSGVPGYAIAATASIMLIGVVMNYLVPDKVFIWISSISTFGAIWTWSMILLSQIKFRKMISPEKKANLKFKMPLYPLTNYLSLAFLLLVLVLMAFNPDTRIALILGPIFIAILVIGYYVGGFHKKYKKVEESQAQQNQAL